MQSPRRVRELGVVVGTLPTGPLNSITDVPGVRVGQTTITGDGLNTGVTAIVPDGWAQTLPAAVAVGNGYGKLVGSTQVDELGVIETPILLTGTLSTFRVADALLTWLLDRDPQATSLNPIVGETNDGYLSDICRRPITPEHVHAALDTASADLPAEGCVGAGTGTCALGFKAGIGTASRTGDHTVGVLVQANFSGLLTVLGRPVPAQPIDADGNSCMIVVATDLPLDSRQLGRLARRAIFAMGRVGSDYAPGSGDYAIAFTTARTPNFPDRDLRTPFQAVTESVEEALLNSLTMARTTTGPQTHTAHAVSHALIAKPQL
ncbi:D-aminopeptidase [Kribbella sp. VKM Ac-2569]|uniref:P1 family peptidase n=1 Tax=Kribbella sp. VKM Ac-2569 TaxID=2512220 RepID=UPI00102B86B0|nr:P1 family peptidase [Kribbella sp. VKM Ac-2569]RZT19526.1 D-aminopeptidase [Kribbella sp. VKM Ac-2569]